MKRSRRFISLVAAAAPMAALTLALTACPKPPPPPPPPPTPTAVPLPSAYCNRPDGMAVTVFIEYDETKKKGVTRTQTAYLCLGKDWIEWVSLDGDVQEPKFPHGSPFDDPISHNKKIVKSGTAKRTGRFEYTIDLLLPNGKKVNVDPRIEVMP